MSETIFGKSKPLTYDEKCKKILTLEAVFVLKIFNFFLLTIWLCGKNGLIRKIKLNSAFIRSKPGKWIIAKDILPNISKTKGTIRQCNLIWREYEKRKDIKNIFVEKSFTKCGGGTSLWRAKTLLIILTVENNTNFLKYY